MRAGRGESRPAQAFRRATAGRFSERRQRSKRYPVARSTFLLLFSRIPCLIPAAVLPHSGRVVKTIINESRPPGAYEVAWLADDDRGTRVASDVYFYVLRANGLTARNRVCVVE